MFLVLISLGALNRLRFKPKLPGASGKLQLCVSIEMVVATLILVLTGLLGTLAPAQM